MYRYLNPILLLVAGSATAVFAHDRHEPREARAGHMLRGYEAVAAALVNDNLDAARSAAAWMANHDRESSLSRPAWAVAQARSLGAARNAFLELSRRAIDLTEFQRGYTVMSCPMVEGGDWIQSDPREVRNPYMGQRMPRCGGPKKTAPHCSSCRSSRNTS